MLKSKIHRAKVTRANLHYIGSITIDQDLMDASGLVDGEQVHVVNLNNGSRLITYVIPGVRGEGEICMNGAGARLCHESDLIIVIGYGMLTDAELADNPPKVVFVDDRNRLVEYEEALDRRK